MDASDPVQGSETGISVEPGAGSTLTPNPTGLGLGVADRPFAGIAPPAPESNLSADNLDPQTADPPIGMYMRLARLHPERASAAAVQ